MVPHVGGPMIALGAPKVLIGAKGVQVIDWKYLRPTEGRRSLGRIKVPHSSFDMRPVY